MVLIIFVVLLLAGVWISLLGKFQPATVIRLSRYYFFITLLIALLYWVFLLTSVENSHAEKLSKLLLDYAKYPANVLIGFLTFYLFRSVHSGSYAASRPILKTISRLTLWGISILTGNIFLIATVGKLFNLTSMRDFFISSGYSVWFLYFIMVVETLGGLGILLHFKYKMGPYAAAGLIIIMAGAIYTHWHNRDPFSDSYSATAVLLNLLLLEMNYYLAKPIRL